MSDAATRFDSPGEETPAEQIGYFGGLPPQMPPVRMQLSESLDSLNDWDRIVLIIGGTILGFCLGFTCTLLLLRDDQQGWTITLLCITNLVNVLFLAQTVRISRNQIRAIERMLVKFS
ncbi:MAG: hypothetical protein AAF539_14275 [Planctomycetota bacterium]